MNNQLIMLILTVIGCSSLQAQPKYLDPEVDLDTRVDDLISRLTLEEKVDQMLMNTSGIPRLDIPPYDYWNEALHGVGRSGKATVFPQAIGLAATFDKDLVYRVASAISDEARAMYNAAQEAENYNRYTGLTFWTPNLNIFRDPRWGRGQETYGEDPYLTSLLGVSFVRGLQGDHPRYLKTAACAKHYAVHSGPEKLRHEFNAVVSQKDLYETYLPAFESLVNAGVESVMCAYNRTNDEPCCASNYLLSEILFDKWGFKGHVVSDCWALTDFFSDIGHGTVSNSIEAAVLALENGVNLNCGVTYKALAEAVKIGLTNESLIDERLRPLLKTRFKLGMFDPGEKNPYNTIPYEVVDSKEHRELANEAASRSIVMLKNNGVLPLKDNLKRFYVVGPNAASIDALLGNYFGVNPNMVTFLEGITAGVSGSSQVQYSPGTTLDRKNINPVDWSTGEAAEADVTIVAMGLTRHIEGEEGESISSPYFGDRIDYNIPENQLEYLRKIRGDHGKPVIAVITGGCPMNLTEVHELADAVLMTWYPGEEGGHALSDVLFGKVSPSGRLPITFPKSLDQLPPYEDYNLKGRTYRYMTAEPMYPFGYGLSYTSFAYRDISLSSSIIKKGQEVEIRCTVKNVGQYEGREIVQLYVTDNKSSVSAPLFSLKGIRSLSLKPGEGREIVFKIIPEMLELINEEGEPILEKGDFTLTISGSLPTQRALTLGASAPVKTTLTLK
ncbi:glycoside hydrolase family 3 C-terminal domain-containing protein [Lentiprolixibacter aurantiacus]|uniref:Glycoside hydrolase family 3 C-terminal domain-containing protein n=1 Tax=Lentiprolixibacter aurantiacus TaxID=2993939 RepID=A0AAE3MN35_9FLAO|nr:glycoside hydrolase family 3 C-terminal domain-containing protein [Lentiprolixibacter aurantiacus]MCX2719917.1 glycoside hydrolase family 3 C-terminal domain-containing protein [Lentiprolixibacter aurantiacus]